MTAFIAHPSVRIKGSEHTYNPVLCQEESCSGKNKGTHMHCPLCTVTEAYQDPVILRAHFRIKHVDKGIDFSGLKILRCCNHCEIVGTIKGEKRFKGAHWHCYRCRNGFNRRDETIKHYKTHFRNPHTTFQIQITQEVNCRQYYDRGTDAHLSAYAGPVVSAELGAETGAVAAILTQRVLDTSENLHTFEAKGNGINNGIIVTSEEDVESSEHSLDKTQTLILMGHEGHGGSLVYEETENIIAEQDRNGLEPTVLLEQKVLELQRQNEILQLEKLSMESQLKAQIQRLQQQVSTMVQTNLKLSEELKQYQSVENGHNRVENLVKSLEEQHRILLQTQLATLSRELLNQAGAMPLNGHMGAEEVTIGLDDIGAKGTDEVNIVEVQSFAPAVEELQDAHGELAPVMDSERSGAVVVQSTTEPLSGKELLLSRKRRPEDEPEQDEQTKLQRI